MCVAALESLSLTISLLVLPDLGDMVRTRDHIFLEPVFAITNLDADKPEVD